MSHELDRSEVIRRERAARLHGERMDAQFQRDVQLALNNVELRRVLGRFFFEMKLDGSPLNTNGMMQSHGIGLQDAARWWINVIRDNCPEREVQIRIEWQNALKQKQLTDKEHEDDN